MDKPSFKLVGTPCGQHGQYTFYKALRITGPTDRIIAIGDFFFVRIWQDSELVSVGELQLLWTDRVSDQTLVSLRLYFLPENTPDGRGQHGEDEVLAINDKVVIRCEDLLSWVWGGGWRHGLRAVWRGACAPPAPGPASAPLHRARLDFSDVEAEKSALEDSNSPGVVVFSYPRYCRYRALLSRLEGIQADWLRDSLVAALGGYAANTENTRILYCKDTFEYPELEGHEFVCNHLAPRLKGRPRGRRRRAHAPRDRSHTPDSRSSDSDAPPPAHVDPKTPRRLSLRNGVPDKQSEEEDQRTSTPEDKAFLAQLKKFHKGRGEDFKMQHSLKDLSLRALYAGVAARGGYEAVCRRQLWRALHPARPARVRTHYERYLLPFENHERRNGSKHFQKQNGRVDDTPIDTIDVTDSPARDVPETTEIREKRLRTPSPKQQPKPKEDIDITSKPAEELNREFLASLPKEEKPLKITVKPVEKLLDYNAVDKNNVAKLFDDNNALVNELAGKYNVKEEKVVEEIASRQLSEGSSVFLSELASRLNLANAAPCPPRVGGDALAALASLTHLGDKYAINGHAPSGGAEKAGRPAGRSSLRAVRVKPARPHHHNPQQPHHPATPIPPARSPPGTNFGIHRPRPERAHSDDEIVEVPYKPKTPEIIDLDEYPESPQSVKKKKLDILKERGLEVTAVPPTWSAPVPLMPQMLNPAMQHQIMTQASLFQMYNIIPQNYANGIQPPKVIQATCTFGSSGPEKTVYGNPKDPFMPPPHILHGTPVKQRAVANQEATAPSRQDILDLTCKLSTPAVEIVRIPQTPSPSKPNPANLSAKNYTLVDGKAVVGSNLEITLVNPKVQTPPKNRAPQKRSSNGKFMSTKTPTPPKDYPKSHPSPSGLKKPAITVPSYQINRDDASPTSSTGSRDSQSNLMQNNMMQNVFKGQNSMAPIGQNVGQMMDKPAAMSPFIDPMYMSALYSSLAGQMDHRQLAMYREYMATQFRGYSGLLGGVAAPTTKD